MVTDIEQVQLLLRQSDF